MNVRDAIQLIAPVVNAGGRWADLGAGTGTFTAALSRLLGPNGAVYAIERNVDAIAALELLARQATRDADAPITVVRADFTRPLDVPALDGVLLANALHFVTDNEQARVLARVANVVLQRGTVVVIEYDDRPPSRWVPFPVSMARLGDLARGANLTAPEISGRRRSDFGGTMYAAWMSRR